MSWSLVAALLSIGSPTAPAPMPWALRYIDLRISVDLAARRIQGIARLDVSARPGAASLVLDLADSMVVDSARVIEPGRLATIRGVREPGHIGFPIPAAAAGAGYRVAVWYHGQPARSAVGFGSGQPSTRGASYGVPGSAMQWWPTLDRPSAKADSADIRITASAALVAVSNGRQVDRVATADGKSATTHWTVRHPIYSDVVSFAIGDYTVTRSTVALANGRRLPLEWYVFPEDSAKAAADFAPVPAILAFYEERLGAYPFGDEKYALVEMARPSFREGQTLSHLGAALLTGKHDNEQVFAHEVAHQWFGNSLTVKSWEEIWLNESLSEYMAWQWIRKSQGEKSYETLIDSARTAPVAAAMVPANPADFNSLFGNATFQRGPAVLVLLEREIGSTEFVAAVRAYVAEHAHGTVATADLQRACEKASGRSLDAFFAQWIRGTTKLGPLY